MTSPSRATVVTFGELLLRLNTPHHQRFAQAKNLEATFAGAEANVAVACSALGCRARFVSALPRHELADAALRQLSSWNVDTSAVLRADGRLGLYFLESGFGVRSSSVIYDRENSAFARTPIEAYPWDEIFATAGWLHLTGITPALAPALRDGLPGLARMARKRGVQVCFDLNYRAKLWDADDARPVLEVVLAESDLVIASLHQLEPVLGLSAGDKTPESAFKVARALREKCGASTVVLTSRETLATEKECRWAAAVTATETVVSASIDYSILDPLGGGDAFCGGLLAGRAEGAPWRDALDLGVAAAAWKYSHHGDYLLARREELTALLQSGGKPGSVVR